MILNKNIDEKLIGKKMILTAIKMEDTLANLLQVEVRILKKKLTNNCPNDDIQNVNKIIKNIILTLTVLDDRIKNGMELMEKDSASKKS